MSLKKLVKREKKNWSKFKWDGLTFNSKISLKLYSRQSVRQFEDSKTSETSAVQNFLNSFNLLTTLGSKKTSMSPLTETSKLLLTPQFWVKCI